MFYYYNELVPELSITECMVYSFIHAIYYRRLQQEEQRKFYGTNAFIVQKLGLSRGTVISTLKRLERKGFIAITYSEDQTQRTITPKMVDIQEIMAGEWGSKIIRGGVQNLDGGSLEFKPLPVQNLNPNNNNNNKKSNNKFNNTDFGGGAADLEKKNSGWTEEKIAAASEMIDSHNIEYRWNEIAKEFKLQKCRCVTKTRVAQYRQRIKDVGGVEDVFWDTIRAALVQSDFLRGKNNRAWKANLDFFLRQSSYVKAAEGAYSNARTGLVGKDTAPIEQAVNGEQPLSGQELVDLFWKM